MNKTKTKTYFQPVFTCFEYGSIPEELMSFQAFASKDDCEKWLENIGYDPQDFVVMEYHDDDIEDVTIIDGDGEVIEINDADNIPYTTSELEEKVYCTSIPYNDSKAFQSALQAVKNINGKLYRQLLWQEYQDCVQE